ncbi:MAG: aspartate-semialdehyde dehydrogenase [Armatimonadetes bacterium]|nr:aspartate-semialdehyde dehydrogenase [Armatimonadota bacterium]
MSDRKFTVAVVGATGAVGTEMIRVLEKRKFPVGTLRAFATSNSAGTTVQFNGVPVTVEDVATTDFKGIDIALFAGGEIASGTYAPRARDAGAVVIDNSSTFRMDPEVPLVVPEVNPHDLKKHKGLIANPNCSTIQMVVALKPLHDKVGIDRVVVSTYQSVSGTGKAAMDELLEQAKAYVSDQKPSNKVYPHRILFNCLPQIGPFRDDGYSEEESKMILEPRKIMGDPNLKITATTVRVPVLVGHSEAVNVTTREKLSAKDARDLLRQAPGVEVVDEPGQSKYPMPIHAAGEDSVFVGRIREDVSQERGLEMWIVSDNLRKGAALNAVQIAEKLVEMQLV